MPSLFDVATSQVGRKILTGITGLLLLFFVIFHLAGNLTIFGEADAMNRYSLMLHDLGWPLWIARAGLVLVFVIHIYIGVSIWWRRRKSRPEGYDVYSSKGEPSRQGLSSRSMALTGVVLLLFVILHVNTFALGDTETVMIDGREASDLRSLVIETFQDPIYAFGYAFVMVLLGTHLGHGIWSAFTSLTMRSRKLSAIVYPVGVILGVALAIGFLFIPLYIYFTGGCGELLAGTDCY